MNGDEAKPSRSLILDVGCGTGALARAMSRVGTAVISLDLDFELLAEASGLAL